MSIQSSKVPVYVETRLVELCDLARAETVARAKNVVEVVRARKSHQIVRINIRAEAPYGGEPSGQRLTYEEELAGKVVTILKRFDARTGLFVRWSDRDGFNPMRFNPDRIPAPRFAFAEQVR